MYIRGWMAHLIFAVASGIRDSGNEPSKHSFTACRSMWIPDRRSPGFANCTCCASGRRVEEQNAQSLGRSEPWVQCWCTWWGSLRLCATKIEAWLQKEPKSTLSVVSLTCVHNSLLPCVQRCVGWISRLNYYKNMIRRILWVKSQSWVCLVSLSIVYKHNGGGTITGPREIIFKLLCHWGK